MIKRKSASLLSLLFMITLLSACSIFHNFSEEQYEEAEKLAIEYIQLNYQDAKEVLIDSAKDSPMGGIVVL